MSEQQSATIIAFPRPRAAPAHDAGANDAGANGSGGDGLDRLRRALGALELALSEQRIAVAAWRENLGALRGSVRGLGASLGAYQSRLGALAEDVGGLHQQARRMEAWADTALSRGGAAPRERTAVFNS